MDIQRAYDILHHDFVANNAFMGPELKKATNVALDLMRNELRKFEGAIDVEYREVEDEPGNNCSAYIATEKQ